jgi:hypothetical protein
LTLAAISFAPLAAALAVAGGAGRGRLERRLRRRRRRPDDAGVAGRPCTEPAAGVVLTFARPGTPVARASARASVGRLGAAAVRAR